MQTKSVTLEPEHSHLVDEHGIPVQQRSALIDEAFLEAAFDRVPWAGLIYLRCDRLGDGKCLLMYRWRAEPNRRDLSA